MSHKEVEDTYWDTPQDLRLSSKDIWLRQRDSRWELKIPIDAANGEAEAATVYEELESDAPIASLLGIKEPLTEARMRESGFEPVGTMITSRKSYRLQEYGVHVDIDDATFPGKEMGRYSVGEVEVIVASQAEAPEAAKRISGFIRQYLSDGEQPWGVPMAKIEHLWSSTRPEDYAKLVQAGVFTQPPSLCPDDPMAPT